MIVLVSKRLLQYFHNFLEQVQQEKLLLSLTTPETSSLSEER